MGGRGGLRSRELEYFRGLVKEKVPALEKKLRSKEYLETQECIISEAKVRTESVGPGRVNVRGKKKPLGLATR